MKNEDTLLTNAKLNFNANCEVYSNTCRDEGTRCVYMTLWAMCMWVHVSTENISVYVSTTLRAPLSGTGA